MEKIYTLARGGRARQFGFEVDTNGVTIYTGKEFNTVEFFSNGELEKIVNHFKGKGWFPLSNDQTGKDLKENGIGTFFKDVLKKFPKYASHVAAYLEKKGKFEFRDDYGFLEFKVK